MEEGVVRSRGRLVGVVEAVEGCRLHGPLVEAAAAEGVVVEQSHHGHLAGEEVEVWRVL